VAQVDRLGPKVSSHAALVSYPSVILPN